jgi:hypothetical protein
VDLVQGIEDLLLLAVADLGGTHKHAAHPIEGLRRCDVGHGLGLR